MTEVTELARAKVNLALHVTGRRPDGYHLLDSLVVFPQLGDRISVEAAARTSLAIDGPFAGALPADSDNLILQAASLMPATTASIRLTKSLPLASGIGGGSADTAATLRALARLDGGPLPPAREVLALGADVPVCMAQRACRMSGIGDRITTIPALPPFWIVLVNPGYPCPTGAVFQSLTTRENQPLPPVPAEMPTVAHLVDWLSTTRNDLEAPAIGLVPAIADTQRALSEQAGCLLVRMSGSGATSFGIFEQEDDALAATDWCRTAHPGWWIAAAPVGD